jgi:hypothetical protein
MTLRKTVICVAVISVLAVGRPCLADIIGREDFDGGAVNLLSTTNVFDFDSGGGSDGDVFGRVTRFAGGLGTGMPSDVADDSVVDVSGGGVSPGDLLGIAGQHTSGFFAMNDMDGAGAPGFTDATWTFDISSALSIDNIQVDLAAMGDFESASSDGFLIEARVDANPFREIFRVRTNESAFKDYRPMDDGGVFSDDDPLEVFIDEAVMSVGFLDKAIPATGVFDTYTSTALSGSSGSTLDIRLSWTGSPSGGEPMGLDRLTINGQVGVDTDCDFTGDGSCNEDDINLLGAEVIAGTNDPAFDLTQDGFVNHEDRDAWLDEAAEPNGFSGAFQLGDSNLDGIADGQDFLDWNTHKFRAPGTATPWSDADWSLDNFVDGGDFTAWNANKFNPLPPIPVTVPEPATLLLVLAASLAGLGWRR